MRFSKTALLLTVAALASAAPALAAAPKNVFRFQVGAFLPTGDNSYQEEVNKYAVSSIDLKVDGAAAVGVAYERRFTELFGLEVGLKYSKPKFKIDFSEMYARKVPEGTVEASTRVMPLTLAALFHPLQGAGKVDFFVGPELVYAMYGSSDFELGSTDYKNQLTWGAKAGLDVPINPKWSFTASVEYMNLKAEVDQTDAPEFNPKPIVVAVGAACKF
mgnify:CR=1 FL=1